MIRIIAAATGPDEVAIRVLTESQVTDDWITAQEARQLAQALTEAAAEAAYPQAPDRLGPADPEDTGRADPARRRT